MELDLRGRRLRAALAAVLVCDNAPELRLVHSWLGSWSGIGLVVVGMTHHGYQVSLGEHGASRWIAVFYRGGGGHEPIAAAGTAWEPTAWRAVQRAARETLRTICPTSQSLSLGRCAARDVRSGRVPALGHHEPGQGSSGWPLNSMAPSVRSKALSRGPT